MRAASDRASTSGASLSNIRNKTGSLHTLQEVEVESDLSELLLLNSDVINSVKINFCFIFFTADEKDKGSLGSLDKERWKTFIDIQE